MTPLFWQHGQIDDEGRHQDGPLQHVDEVHGDMVGIISEWIAYRPVQTSIRTGQRQTTDLPDSTSLRGGFRYFKSVQDHVKGRGKSLGQQSLHVDEQHEAKHNLMHLYKRCMSVSWSYIHVSVHR